MGGRLEFSLSDSVHQNDISFQQFISPGGLISLNQWNHVAAVFDQPTATRRLYVNGSKVAEHTDSAFVVFSSFVPVTIGIWEGSPWYLDFQFQGRIDEVDLFNRALTDSEISAIFHAGHAGKCN